MQLPIFQNAYFLQSVGWSIANSFWQAALLWLIYQILTAVDKKMSSLVKYNLSVILMVMSFAWFVYTIVENYYLSLNAPLSQTFFISNNLFYQLQKFNEVLPYLSITYFVVLFIYSIQFIRKLVINDVLQHTGLTKPNFDIRLFIRNTAKHLGIKLNVQVWISSNVDVPSVTGFFKPIILLPATFLNDLSVNQVEAILLHELAHIKRNDYLVNLFQSVIETIMFFNPFVLLMGKAVREERENCCDDWVLNYQYSRHDYAQALLRLEESRNSKQVFALAATDSKKILLKRIKRLFSTSVESPNMRNKERYKFITLILTLFLGTLVLVPELSLETKIKDEQVKTPSIVNNSGLLIPLADELNIKKKENKSAHIIRTEPVLAKTASKIKINNPSIKPRKAKPVAETYMNAYINEDLLPGNSKKEPAVTLIADRETEAKKYYIKIEEQESGSTQINTYFLELNNKDGKANFKPLIILEKLSIPIRTIKTEKTNNSSLIKSVKKRTTS